MLLFRAASQQLIEDMIVTLILVQVYYTRLK